MRFPYQRSAGQDLRDLFKYERLRSTTDDLGQSAIDEGSGSLEVRDGDGTTVVGIGDLPGGGVGIAIRWNGSLTDLANLFQGILDRLEVVEEMEPGDGSGNNDVWDARQDRDLAGLRRRAGSIEGKNTTQDQKLGTLGSRADDTDVDLAGLAKRVGALESAKAQQAADLGEVRRDVDNNAKGLGEIEKTSRRQGQAIEDQRNKGDTLENLMEDAQSRQTEDRGWIDLFRDWLPDLDVDIDNVWVLSLGVQSEVTTARAGRPTLHGRLTEMTNNTSTAQSTADGVTSEVQSARAGRATLHGRLVEMTNNTSTAQSSADQANDRITDARGSDGSLTSRLNRMENETAAADTKAVNAQSTANTANTKATNAQSDVQEVAGDLATGLNTLISYINNLRARVAALDGGPGGPVGL